MTTDLQIIDVDTGEVLDTVRLVDGTIHTGQFGREFFAGKRRAISAAGAEGTDAELFASYTDWSNGYIQIQSKPAGPSPELSRELAQVMYQLGAALSPADRLRLADIAASSGVQTVGQLPAAALSVLRAAGWAPETVQVSNS